MRQLKIYSKIMISLLLIFAIPAAFFCFENNSVKAAEVTLSSDMNYINMSKYTQVLLPTSKHLAFTLDPQGLSSISESIVSADSIEGSSGKIISSGEVSIVNYSYYPLKAKVKLYLTDTGGSNFVDTSANIDFDKEKRICLTVTPSSTKTTVTTSDTAIIGTMGYTASNLAIPVTSNDPDTADSIAFVLAGADYNLETSSDISGNILFHAERDLTGDYGVATFKIGGAMNKYANWSSYIGRNAKNITLNAVFSYDIITKEEYTYLTDSQNSHIHPETYNMLVESDSVIFSAN